jgi:hypothetical protein
MPARRRQPDDRPTAWRPLLLIHGVVSGLYVVNEHVAVVVIQRD